ncbi:MAG: cytidine deaminase [Actinomycetales bacterium]|nr:cytidine deaminase [Candidatus Lutibacillus vidarii]
MTAVPTHDELLALARAAAGTAYAPYSEFPVGAAVLGADGTVHTGCNVENAAYGLTTCAERGAISAMVRAGTRRIDTVAIVGLHAAPCYPCGACRQALAEFGCRTVVVEVDGAAKAHPFVELLPHGFGPADLQ